jgi:hypothetical protein
LGEEEWYSEGLLVGQAAKATLEKSLEAYERKQGLCRFARFRPLVVNVTFEHLIIAVIMKHSHSPCVLRPNTAPQIWYPLWVAVVPDT